MATHGLRWATKYSATTTQKSTFLTFSWARTGRFIRNGSTANTIISRVTNTSRRSLNCVISWGKSSSRIGSGRNNTSPTPTPTGRRKSTNVSRTRSSAIFHPDNKSHYWAVNCGRERSTILNDDAYYCNKELVELLVFDAKVTNDSYQSWSFKSEREREVVETYSATVRFVGTMSGLTRWQFIFGEVEVDTDTEFGDFHSTAINEAWYKNAILQHQIDKQSFVYSVPHHADEREDNEIKVTASMAIFPRDGGMEAPSCVVGFQFSHALMYERFMEITSKVKVCRSVSKSALSVSQFPFSIHV